MRIATATLAAIVLVATGCSDESLPGAPPVASGPSAAFGIWVPGPSDDCTVEQHDQYAVVGPDGKLYPTWHPPLDPATGCSFGHEHGRDPRGSALYRSVGPIPFGVANEALDTWDPSGPRHEDHVGHKIEWENDVPMHFGSDAANAIFEVRCDVLAKLHQGSHSKDAFTNNLHELVYHIRCSDGTEMHVTMMAAIGTPGQFQRSCDGTTVVVGPASPGNSPDGGGQRIIPDRFCVEQEILRPAGQQSNFGVLHESWQTSNRLAREDGHTIVAFNPYFQVFRPSRFFDPAQATLVGRPMDVCYEVLPSGERAQGGECAEATGDGTITGITYNDPRSPFNGVRRQVDINDNVIRNGGGPTVWYTDPFGGHGRNEPFPGAVRQWVAHIDNDRGDLQLEGPTLGRERDYGTTRTHVPN